MAPAYVWYMFGVRSREVEIGDWGFVTSGLGIRCDGQVCGYCVSAIIYEQDGHTVSLYSALRHSLNNVLR
jgi:hypothetical protein